MIAMIILYSRRSDTSLDENERDDAGDELSIETDESMETGEFDIVFDDQLVYANPLSGEDFISCDGADGFTEIGFDETGL
jgi:hypothetical protein